jgi:hypothetical protein
VLAYDRDFDSIVVRNRGLNDFRDDPTALPFTEYGIALKQENLMLAREIAALKRQNEGLRQENASLQRGLEK